MLEFQSSLPRHSSISTFSLTEKQKNHRAQISLGSFYTSQSRQNKKYLPMFKNYHSQRLPRLAALPNTSTHAGSALSTRPSSSRLLCPPRPRVCPHKAAAWTRYSINSHYNSRKRAKPQPQHIAPAKKLAKKRKKTPMREHQSTTLRISFWEIFRAQREECVKLWIETSRQRQACVPA